MESVSRSKQLINDLARRLKIYQGIEDVLGIETSDLLKATAKNLSKRMDLERRRIECLIAAHGK